MDSGAGLCDPENVIIFEMRMRVDDVFAFFFAWKIFVNIYKVFNKGIMNDYF